jgi:SAM-dependent methyltransferase
MNAQKTNEVQTSYDRVADEYTRRIADELAHKPLDRELLDRFATRVQGLGPVCDLGCGPGHVARYLYERGVAVFGIDLSSAMIERAKVLNPQIVFKQGDMRSLEVDDNTLAGIAAFYSIIHIPRCEVVGVLAEIKRVLQPGGVVLVAFHIGDEDVHLEEWWGQNVSVDFFFFRPDEVRGFLAEAGFIVEDVIERDPYEGVEHPSRRAYIFAMKSV